MTEDPIAPTNHADTNWAGAPRARKAAAKYGSRSGSRPHGGHVTSESSGEAVAPGSPCPRAVYPGGNPRSAQIRPERAGPEASRKVCADDIVVTARRALST